MFWSTNVLTTRGPLGKVWLAAQWDKRLSKAQCAAADIDQAVDDIIKPQQPLALRTSGTLLLGCARIYEFKLAMLFQDCANAMKRLQTSSKATGAVDLPEHARTGTEKQLNRKAQTYGFGLNDDDDDSVVLGDMAALDDAIEDDFTLMKGNFNQAAADDITLRTVDQNLVPEEGADDDLFGDMGFGPEALRTAGTPASNAASSARVDDADLLDVGMPDVASLMSGASGASAASKRRSNAAAEAAAAVGARASLASAPVRDSMGAPTDEFGLLPGGEEEDAFAGEMPMMDMEAASDDELLGAGDADLLGSVRDTDGTSGISELVESETESQAEAAADAAARAADKRKARRRRAAGAVRDEVISIPSRVLKGWISNTERHLLPRPLGRRRTRLARQIAKADHAGLVNTEDGFTQLLKVPMGLRHDMVAPQLLQLFAAHASDNLPYARRSELELKNEIRGVLGLELFDEHGAAMEMPPAVDDLPEDDDGGFMPMADLDEDDGLLPTLDDDAPTGRPSLLDAAFARGADSASVAASAMSAPSSAGMASTAEARLGAASESDSQAIDDAGTVPVHKWHSRTKRMARVLAEALKANEASVNDPMDAQASFSSLAMGSSKRSAASAFYEVLALATWDVVSVQQSAPFSDINVGRTANFESTIAAVNA